MFMINQQQKCKPTHFFLHSSNIYINNKSDDNGDGIGDDDVGLLYNRKIRMLCCIVRK